MPKSTNSSSSSNVNVKRSTTTILKRNRSKFAHNSYACRKKEKQGQTDDNGKQGNNGSEYTKLYKHFGPDRKNKDVRVQMQGRINEDVTSKLGPLMQLNINPAFQIEQRMDVTQFRDTFKGEKVEETDKVYFRRKDEITEYAECMFKSKVLIEKK